MKGKKEAGHKTHLLLRGSKQEKGRTGKSTKAESVKRKAPSGQGQAILYEKNRGFDSLKQPSPVE